MPCRLYLITPGDLAPGRDAARTFAEPLKRALGAGDVACLQLRLKDCDDDAIRAAVEELMPVCADYGVAFILNDRPDIAAAMGCDGVHVGQDDTPFAEARALMGPDRVVGVTCKVSRHLAMAAAEAGADYVAFGAFFPSTTKITSGGAKPDLLAWWSGLFDVPCVAIGGITAENCTPVVRAGADFLAIASGVWVHPGGPAAGVAAVNAAIGEAEAMPPLTFWDAEQDEPAPDASDTDPEADSTR